MAVETTAGGGTQYVEPLCEDGVVKDDGIPETGYGWVQSVVEGIFVQEYHVSEFAGEELETVCVCWMRNRQDTEINFDVVIYGDADGVPMMSPAFVIPAVATDVPEALDGAFYEVDLSESGVRLGQGTFYVGARWNPSLDQNFFVCVDKSDDTPVVGGFFIDDRADEWADMLDTMDSTFLNHRALLVRVVGAEAGAMPVPTLSVSGAAIFVLLLAALAVIVLRRGIS